MIRHIPVLLSAVLENLDLKPGMNVIDCTLGDGGHADKMLEVIGEKGKLMGIDADVEAILRAKRFLYNYENNTVFVRDNFVNLKKIVEENEFNDVNAVLLDLGWSTPQFMERGRGFSFRNDDEELDMRFSGSAEGDLTAAKIVNTYSEEELEKIIRRYGEDNYSRKIASNIVERRKKKLFETVGDLVEIIKVSKPSREKIHPATRTFQALRIEVNNELEILKKVIPQAIDVLKKDGRLAVISFHSLEDRIAKQIFARLERTGNIKILSKKPIMADEKEIEENKKSRSAKMRVIQKK